TMSAFVLRSAQSRAAVARDGRFAETLTTVGLSGFPERHADVTSWNLCASVQDRLSRARRLTRPVQRGRGRLEMLLHCFPTFSGRRRLLIQSGNGAFERQRIKIARSEGSLCGYIAEPFVGRSRFVRARKSIYYQINGDLKWVRSLRRERPITTMR